MLRHWCSDVELLWCSFLGWRVWFQIDSFFAFRELTFLAGVLNPNGTVQSRLWEPGLLGDFTSCSELELKWKNNCILEEGSEGRKMLDCNKNQFPLLAFLAIFSLPWWLQVLCFWFNWGFSHPVLKHNESCAAFFFSPPHVITAGLYWGALADFLHCHRTWSATKHEFIELCWGVRCSILFLIWSHDLK